jgi:hypothetical protein
VASIYCTPHAASSSISFRRMPYVLESKWITAKFVLMDYHEKVTAV